ncbi:PREDICTED: protein lethal(2)essential for life-like [Papilio polytes]|uniref:protein lethal(2)essential for life-like n=1 Tax=Papilio polytes TaxID=76194 RepID=UPI0006766CF3|nr:PREDICTED: protein lethal(2)essential for life-like [Papilio polytes]
MSLWPSSQNLFGDEVVLRSIDWLENFPWRNESSVSAERDKFEIHMSLHDFKPEEISIKTADGYIIVKGQHEEKQDEYGFVSRQFVRRYALPEGCLPESVESKISPNGLLTITATRQPVIKRDIVIPVSHEGSNNLKSKL